MLINEYLSNKFLDNVSLFRLGAITSFATLLIFENVFDNEIGIVDGYEYINFKKNKSYIDRMEVG